MRRLFSIFCIIILLFNFIGYQLLLDYLISQQSSLVAAKVERNEYVEEDLVSFKAPINLPYFSNTEAFEEVYGSVEVDGVVYQYVKRRIYNDSLELLCLPHAGKQQLQHAKTEFIKLSVDHQTGRQDKRIPGVIKLLLPDFFQADLSFSIPAIHQERAWAFEYQFHILAGFTTSSDQPPDVNVLS